MPFTLMQVGSMLKSVNTDGGLSPALTLPNGVSLATNLQPRFARFKRYVVLVNTPTRPVSIDVDGVVRVLTPAPPNTAVVLSGPNAGTLTGTYLSKQTFRILDALGNVISESDYGPAMATAVSITNKKLKGVGVSSADDISASMFYRTATGPGAAYFQWTQVDGNPAAPTVENDLSDAAIGLFDAPALGTAPDLTLIAEFAGRLWGVDRVDVDNLRYTEAGTMYGWSALNSIIVPRLGADQAGVTALIPRRAALGVCRRDTVAQVTGSQRTNFTPVIVNGGEKVGCVSQESVVVTDGDVAYFLARDGVYRWDSNGITCVTDGLVRTWFTTDDTFNRSMFWRAFAQIDPFDKKYYLFLASKGSDTLDKFIAMDMNTGAWFGPHETSAFTPSCAILVAGRNQQLFYMVGSRDGYLSQTQEARNDWGLFPIDLHVTVRSEEMDEPSLEKYYGELEVHVDPQATGTLDITPELGSVDETTATPVMEMDLTLGRQRVGRIGTGNSMVLNFENDELDVDAAIYGYEVNPVNIIGQR